MNQDHEVNVNQGGVRLDSEYVHSQTESHSQGPSQRPRGLRGQNFCPQEDVFLCHAWLNINTDPIASNYQSGQTYWQRITQEYNKLKSANFPDRTEKSLTQRWSLHISPDCSKFAGCVASVERRHPSGMVASNLVSFP